MDEDYKQQMKGQLDRFTKQQEVADLKSKQLQEKEVEIKQLVETHKDEIAELMKKLTSSVKTSQDTKDSAEVKSVKEPAMERPSADGSNSSNAPKQDEDSE